MNDVHLLIAHDPADKAGADRLKASLVQEISSRNIDRADQPEITLQAGFENLPDPATFGALSLVVVYLPDPSRGFTPAERAGFEVFRKMAYPENRLIPIASDAVRNRPPVPLDDIKSFPLHQAGGAAKLTTLLLNLICLRLAGDKRKVFISYKISDGLRWARDVAKGLRERGYDVWRDDDLDRDGLNMLTPGEPAQKKIQDAILRHGFVLLIDSMEAPLSGWVQEEVSTAIKCMLPVLPVVVEDSIAGRDPRLILVPKPGGRFFSIRELGREVRVDNARQAQAKPLDNAFFDELERVMNETLLGHLRDRRRLIAETRERFRRRMFEWIAVQEEQLLYEVSLTRDSDLTPELRLVLLVQCAPYATVLEETVRGVCDLYRTQRCPHQYVVLVHRAPLYPSDKRRLIAGNGAHVMLLHTDEIDQLPSVFSI